MIKMKPHWKLSVLLLTFVILSTGDCQTTSECKDQQSWCKSLGGTFCDTPALKKICSETCGTCNSSCAECQQKCDTSTNTCTCLEGYTLMDDLKNCKNIDECKTNPCGGEKPHCIDNPGSYRCVGEISKCALKTGYTIYYGRSTCCKQTSTTQVFGKCGFNIHNKGLAVENSTLKIVGGEMALSGMWPWMAHLNINGQFCGGSLINDRWIVTAAHCFESYLTIPESSRPALTITFGMTNSSDTSESMRQVRKSKQIIIHEQYKYPKYDIALVEIDVAVKWSEFVNPICLPNGEVPPVETKCYATGFGTTAFQGQISDVLQQVDLPIVKSETCVKRYENEAVKVDPTIMLCAGYEVGGKDACQGDSGGPLVCQRCDSCDFYLAGLVSFGKGCALPKNYGVYTHVEKFENWIARKITSVTIKKRVCVKTEFSSWQKWSDCSTTCGPGERQRLRICINGIVGQEGCVGSTKQVEDCEVAKCPVWGDWTTYSGCSATCGTAGIKIRTRPCVNCSPSRTQTEQKPCNRVDCPSAKWSVWSEWVKCTLTCGGGKQRRQRTCENGEVGKPGCIGRRGQTRACNKQACSVPFGSWSDWNACSTTCGGGLQKRSRSCPTTPCVEDEFGSSTTQTRPCETQQCPHWGPWSDFGSCSKICDSGVQVQTRECIGGTSCTGNSEKSRPCNTNPCVVWEAWAEWGACSATCGTSSRERTRECTKIDQTKSCVGNAKETETCQVPSCPEICNESCQQLVTNYECLSFIAITSRGCSSSCCECVDDPTVDCSSAWLGFDFTCTTANTAFQCKRSCGLCF